MLVVLSLLFVAAAGQHSQEVSRVPVTVTVQPNTSTWLYVHLDIKFKFYVFSAHCRTSPIIMSFVNDIFYPVDFVNTTDPALVYVHAEEDILQPVGPYLINRSSRPVLVQVLVHGYTKSDPVPGWCSTKAGVHPKPFLRIDWNSDVVRLNFTKASLLDTTVECNMKEDMRYEVYQRFLPDGSGIWRQDLKEEFANDLANFVEVEDIRKWGTLVQTGLGEHVDRLTFSAYPPTGSLFAVLVHHLNGTSLYSIGHTYGCDINPDTGLCIDPAHVVSKVVCAFAVFVGLLMAFAGHRFFLTSQVLFGFYAGCSIGYILLDIHYDMDFLTNYCSTASCGLLGGLLTGSLWWFFGLPVLSVLLPTLEVGVLAASLLMYLPFMNVPSMTSDSYYWLVFVCVMLAFPLILLAFTQKASILSCVLIGTYAILLPVDYYVGTNLRYISINIIRRATSESNFQRAIIHPPFQTADLALVACFLALAGLALVCQLINERKKAPFPASPFQQWRWRREEQRIEDEESETSPLMPGEDILSTGVVVATPVVGYILGHHRPVTGSVMTSSQHQGMRRGGGSRRQDIFKPPDEELPAYYSPLSSPAHN